MNYRGSYKKLLGNAKAAMIAAIEIYNKPIFEYRDECVAILLLNAWELVLKALLSKNKESIFYKKQQGQPYKTLSWKDALMQGSGYFPKEISVLPVKENLRILNTYRDNAVHFYNSKDISVVLHSLAQAAIVNFRDLLEHCFNVRLEDEINWRLLPLGVRPPIDAVSYISNNSGAAGKSELCRFLSELQTAQAELEKANEDTGRLLTISKIKLESVKKASNADAVVSVGKNSVQNNTHVVIRTQDPNKSHPLRQTEILRKIKMLHGKPFTRHTFQAIAWKYRLKEKPQYCWKASEGGLTKYSNEVAAFIKHLAMVKLETALDEYRDYLRLRRKGASRT